MLGFWDLFGGSIAVSPDGGNFIIFDNLEFEVADAGDVPDLVAYLRAGGYLPTPVLAGDYNQNGTVDAADYTLWRNNLGSGTSLANDDTPGVGPDDYARWKTHFGQSGGSGSGATDSASALATVPEPAAALLLALGLLVAPILRCRRSTSPNRRQSPTIDKKREND